MRYAGRRFSHVQSIPQRAAKLHGDLSEACCQSRDGEIDFKEGAPSNYFDPNSQRSLSGLELGFKFIHWTYRREQPSVNQSACEQTTGSSASQCSAGLAKEEPANMWYTYHLPWGRSENPEHSNSSKGVECSHGYRGDNPSG